MKKEETIVPILVAQRLSKWVAFAEENFKEKKSGEKKKKPVPDAKFPLVVDGHATIVFTDGLVQLKTFVGKVIVKT